MSHGGSINSKIERLKNQLEASLSISKKDPISSKGKNSAAITKDRINLDKYSLNYNQIIQPKPIPQAFATMRSQKVK